MDNNETQPKPDATDAPPPFGDPDMEDLMKFLEQEVPDLSQLLGGLFSGVQRDEKAHDAQMLKVGNRQRAAMAESDREQKESESAEAEPLAWGLWRSECGCLHLAVPDGRGGWAANIEEVAPEKLLEVINGMIRGLGEAGLTMLRALAEAGDEAV